MPDKPSLRCLSCSPNSSHPHFPTWTPLYLMASQKFGAIRDALCSVTSYTKVSYLVGISAISLRYISQCQYIALGIFYFHLTDRYPPNWPIHLYQPIACNKLSQIFPNINLTIPYLQFRPELTLDPGGRIIIQSPTPVRPLSCSKSSLPPHPHMNELREIFLVCIQGSAQYGPTIFLNLLLFSWCPRIQINSICYSHPWRQGSNVTQFCLLLSYTEVSLCKKKCSIIIIQWTTHWVNDLIKRKKKDISSMQQGSLHIYYLLYLFIFFNCYIPTTQKTLHYWQALSKLHCWKHRHAKVLTTLFYSHETESVLPS